MNIIPGYVADEIKYYLEERKNGYNDSYTISNICALTNLSYMNNGITKENADILKKKVRRLWYRNFEHIKEKKHSHFSNDQSGKIAQELEQIIIDVFVHNNLTTR